MKEYGGYLPLELHSGREYYNYGSENIIRLNSGLTAIYCALKIINPQRVFMPHFICPTVEDLVASMGFKIVKYYINENFEPINLKCSVEDCVILVNYFGLNSKVIRKYYSQFEHIIIDNTQAFFSEPIIEKNVYNVYSCRKFIGVPDGGYLIGTNLPEISLKKDFSSNRSGFLMMQYEYGINGAYDQSRENYNQIRDKRLKMSDLTQRILQSADYSHIKAVRKHNFSVLHELLADSNVLIFDSSYNEVPYSYPFMLEADIRNELVNKKIYVPWIWKEKTTDMYKGKYEYNFSKNIFHLPIDQRYNENDMCYIAQIVIGLLEGKV